VQQPSGFLDSTLVAANPAALIAPSQHLCEGATDNPSYLAHLNKECTPCNYFYYKADGCRQGADCPFCHLCPKGEIKRRKKERVRMLKAQSQEEGDQASPLIAVH
jgi:hypothetical protein